MEELILPFVVFTINAFRDRVLSNMGQTYSQARAWHIYNALILATLFLFISYILQDWFYPLYVASVRFWFFNILLNALRKKPLLSLGTTSFIDKLFVKSKILTLTVFIGSLILSIYLAWNHIN